MDLSDVGGKLVDELVAVGRVRAYDPKDELMLRHRLDVAVHPGGHAAVNIGIAAFQDQADSHEEAPVLAIRTDAEVA